MLAYPAHIEKQDDGYLVTFPDLENVMTYGATIEEALLNAEEALNGCIESDFERNFTILSPSSIEGETTHSVPVTPHIVFAIMLRTLRADRPQTEVARQLNISSQVYSQSVPNPTSWRLSCQNFRK